jgi:hypothetical protein
MFEIFIGFLVGVGVEALTILLYKLRKKKKTHDTDMEFNATKSFAFRRSVNRRRKDDDSLVQGYRNMMKY